MYSASCLLHRSCRDDRNQGQPFKVQHWQYKLQNFLVPDCLHDYVHCPLVQNRCFEYMARTNLRWAIKDYVASMWAQPGMWPCNMDKKMHCPETAPHNENRVKEGPFWFAGWVNVPSVLNMYRTSECGSSFFILSYTRQQRSNATLHSTYSPKNK